MSLHSDVSVCVYGERRVMMKAAAAGVLRGFVHRVDPPAKGAIEGDPIH